MRKTNASLGILLAVFLAACKETPRAAPDQPDPLFLNAASQDRAIFLTWNAAPGFSKVTLRCRRAGAESWRTIDGGPHGAQLVEGLDNDFSYECEATREMATGATIHSHPVTQTPRSRPAKWAPLYFGSQQAAEAWANANPDRLRPFRHIGRGPLDWGPSAPDGLYVDATGMFLFFLLRFADDRFQPPTVTRRAADVRAVLKRALWPAQNPFDHPERFPMPITSIDPPMVGNVHRFHTAKSFSIAYHPELSSRYTWFGPRDPSPGRVAIYMDGHQGHTVRHGAAIIDALLDRGWEVIAVDMPLLGANSVDKSETLRKHSSFTWRASADLCPVSLFLQPLKALVDAIYRDHGSDANLTVLLMGKSGGGWTSFMYGALDPRVHYVVSVAGGIPMSMWLRKSPVRIGDYEQTEPRVYEVVPYEDIMPAAGSRGAFYVFNEHDPCCSALPPDDPFVHYLRRAGLALHKPIDVYVDSQTRHHAFTPAAFEVASNFVEATESGNLTRAANGSRAP